MPQKNYLVGYDISDPKRQAVVRYKVKNHTSSGQKSAYECALSSTDKQQLTTFVNTEITPNDAFFYHQNHSHLLVASCQAQSATTECCHNRLLLFWLGLSSPLTVRFYDAKYRH